jgi:hypothetical protein
LKPEALGAAGVGVSLDGAGSTLNVDGCDGPPAGTLGII